MYKVKVGDFKIGLEERSAINEVLDSGRISEGKKVAEFEVAWAKYIGTKYAVAVSSGTAALMCALYTLKQLYGCKGDVLTHRVTFIATHNAIKACGFRPVFNVAAEVAVPVHLMGYPQWLDADYVIEDACQAHGSIFEGKKLGSIGLMGCFSFYIAHNIQAGEMGAVTTNDLDCYKTLKKIKAHGRVCDCPVCLRSEGKCPRPVSPDPRFSYDIFGLNFKTMEFQAALALCQVKKADLIKKQRSDNVKYLNNGLVGLAHLELPKYSSDISYLAYPIKSAKRDEIREKLDKAGIESRPLFNHPTGFYIGCHQYLTQEDLDYTIQILTSIVHSLT